MTILSYWPRMRTMVGPGRATLDRYHVQANRLRASKPYTGNYPGSVRRAKIRLARAERAIEKTLSLGKRYAA